MYEAEASHVAHARRRCRREAWDDSESADRGSVRFEIMARKPRETSLYRPVKRYLEELGFRVKGEICGCDLVALRGEEPAIVIVGELKLSFNLELLLQGIDRIAACDEIWLAVRM